MIRSSRRHMLLAASVVLVAAVAGCGSSASNEPASGPVTLRLLANITPALTESYYTDLVKPWVDQHPNVTVKVESPTANTTVTEAFQQDIAAGNVPDFISGEVQAAGVPALAALPDADWVKNASGSYLTDENGKIWAVAPVSQIQSLIFYNKDVFTKAGITDVPKTLDNLTAAMQKIKATTNVLPMLTAGDWVTGAQFNELALGQILRQGPPWKNITSGSLTFANSDYKPYLEAYATWVKQGYLDNDALGVKYEDTYTAFASGKFAMYPMGAWAVPSIDDAKPSFQVGVFASPSVDGSPALQYGNGAQTLFIPKGGKHQDLVLDLVKYLVTDKTALTKACKSESNFAKGISYAGSPLQTEVAKIFDSTPGLANYTTAPAGFDTEVGKQIQSLYVGGTADSVLKDLQDWWKANVK